MEIFTINNYTYSKLFTKKYIGIFILSAFLLNILVGIINIKTFSTFYTGQLSTTDKLNQYEVFDSVLDSYLLNKDEKSFLKFKNLSFSINSKTGDKQTLDQFYYYEKLKKNKLDILYKLRKEKKRIENSLYTMDKTVRFTSVEGLIKEFTDLKAGVEILECNLILARCHLYEQENLPAQLIINQNLIEIEKKYYLAIKCKYLLYLASIDFSSDTTGTNFRSLISLSEQLGLDKVRNQGYLGLAKFYEVNNNDLEAEKICRKLLDKDLSKVGEIVNYQILAISQSKQKDFIEAGKYAEFALSNAVKNEDNYNISLTHLIAAIIYTESNLLDSALSNLLRAETNLKYSNLTDPSVELLTFITAQKAKIQHKRGLKGLAEKNYQTAIDSYTVKNKSNKLLAWLYLSLALSTEDHKLEKRYRTLSENYKQLSLINKESYSDFFNVTPK